MPTRSFASAPPSPTDPSPGPAFISLRVCVVGSGYVGLVAGACLASLGHSVTCVDRDAQRIAAIERGQIPFFEPGLEELVARGRAVGPDGEPCLRFSTRIEDAVTQADLVIVAVGTPMAEDGEHTDLTQVYAAVEAAARGMREDAVLVIKSTAPVGTGDEVQRLMHRLRPQAPIAVASNPEFLREGSAIEDFCRPARVVIGSDSPWAAERMQRLYAPLQRQGVPLVMTSRRTAELIKYAANSFLATKLAFINEMADLCERIGADVEDVALGMGLDPRIGSQYLRAGPGYGGSCLPKDLLALSCTARTHQSPLRIVDAVIALNAQRADTMVDKIRRACGGQLDGKTIAILGVAFKPDTDDVRAAPAVALIQRLQAEAVEVRMTDPQAIAHASKLFPNVRDFADPYACATGADAVVLVTEWHEYRHLDLPRLCHGMRGNAFVDLRNAYRAIDVTHGGFSYTGIGLGHTAFPEVT